MLLCESEQLREASRAAKRPSRNCAKAWQRRLPQAVESREADGWREACVAALVARGKGGSAGRAGGAWPLLALGGTNRDSFRDLSTRRLGRFDHVSRPASRAVQQTLLLDA